MKYLIKHPFLQLLSLIVLMESVACSQGPAGQHKTSSFDASTQLTMEQTADGNWVIMDAQKTKLYEVFIFDNGPDYAADGLIRIVKNGKIGYADASTYAQVIAPQFDCAFPFKNGIAKVSNQCRSVPEGEYSRWESDNWQYVDKQGNLSAVQKDF